MTQKKRRWPQVIARKVWFLGNDLVTIHHKSESAGIVVIKNLTQDRLESMTMKEFRRFRKRAYTITEAAELLNHDRSYLSRRAKEGYWPPPVGRNPGGRQYGTQPAYYNEDHLYQIRNIMSQIHAGRPRKDGFVTNNQTPTETQLRAAINNQLFVYVKDNDGNFIPTFDVFDSR